MNIPATKAEVDALQPGYLTDVLVCHVAGIEPLKIEAVKMILTSLGPAYPERFDPSSAFNIYPHLSTDNAAAITYLLPLCIQPEENFLCISLAGPEADGGWGATLGYNPLGFGLGATADSLAMAMCKAFLLFKLPISGEG